MASQPIGRLAGCLRGCRKLGTAITSAVGFTLAFHIHGQPPDCTHNARHVVIQRKVGQRVRVPGLHLCFVFHVRLAAAAAAKQCGLLARIQRQGRLWFVSFSLAKVHNICKASGVVGICQGSVAHSAAGVGETRSVICRGLGSRLVVCWIIARCHY